MRTYFIVISCIATLLFTGCSSSDDAKETDIMNRAELELKSGDTFQLEMISGDKNASFLSGDKLVAEVSSDGLVKAMRIGKCNIAAGHARCEVTVSARYDYYTEPTDYMGKSRAEIRELLGEPYSEGERTVGYILTGNFFIATTISFSDDKVYAVSYSFDDLKTNKLLEYLDERYVRFTPMSDVREYLYHNAFTQSQTTLSIGIGFASQSGTRSVIYTLNYIN